MSPSSVTADPTGKYAYVANGSSNTVSQYTIGADGSLTTMATATVAAGTTPASVTVIPLALLGLVSCGGGGGGGGGATTVTEGNTTT